MTRKGRILVVEDNLLWQRELIDMLTGTGFLVDTAATVQQARERIANNFYHMITLDIRLEESDTTDDAGMALLSELTRSAQGGDISVLMISGYAHGDHLRKAFRDHHVADFFDKGSFDEESFLQRVAEIFAKVICVNLRLKIHWGDLIGPLEVSEKLKLSNLFFDSGSTLHQRVATELDDLLCRLFHDAEGVALETLETDQDHSVSGALQATPIYAEHRAGSAMVVKLGVATKAGFSMLDSAQATGLPSDGERARRTPLLAGISYLMIRKKHVVDLLSNLDLGSSVAETDSLLQEARIQTSVYEDLLKDRVDLIPGTKGSGKTALYRIFVDFLPQTMLDRRRVVVAHGVQQRQDTVFLAYNDQFEKLSESDFLDFWCIYLISLANEQFLKNDLYETSLADCREELKAFRRAYKKARIPELDRSRNLREIISWTLAVLSKLKPKVTWSPPEDVGEFEISLGHKELTKETNAGSDHPLMANHIEGLITSLEQLLSKASLSLWLMLDRLDELFARRSDTERKALRGLLQTLRFFRSERIRIKLFLRDDIFEHLVGDEGFTALTHVTARKADTLRWSEDQILSVIVKRVFANPDFKLHFRVDEVLLKTSIEYQRQLFYKVFPDTVYRSPNQSPTIRWIYNHTKDGRGVVTPRDVIEVIGRASQHQRDAYRDNFDGSTDRLILGPAIVYGLEELSIAKRVNYLQAEFPHKWGIIRKLLGGGTEYSESAMKARLGESAQQEIEDLISIGVISRASKKGALTYRIPYLYRKGLECTQRYVAD